MSFSYSGSPGDSDLDEVRFLIQDTDSTAALFADEEVQFAIDKLYPLYADNLMAAAYLCDVLAASYSGEGSISADGVSVSFADVQDQYTKMSARFRTMHNELQGVGAQLYVGGVDCFEWPDFGIKPKVFGLRGLDNRFAGQQDYGSLTGYPVATDAPESGAYWYGP